MSTQALGQFVHRLHRELESYKEYRALLNLEPHTFVFNKRSLAYQTKVQLTKGGRKLPPEVDSKIKELSNKYGNMLVSKLESIAGRSLPKPGGKVTLIFSQDTDIPLPDYYKMPALALPVFSRVKIAYRDVLNSYFSELQDWLEKYAEDYLIRNRDNSVKKSIRGFFDAGHEEGYGVFERFIDQATLNIAKSLEYDIGENTEQARDKIVSELSNLGIELEITKSPADDSIVIKVESSYLNRSRGARVGQKSKKLRQAVLNFIEKNPLEDLSGSDTISQKKRKETVKRTLGKFKNLKNKDVSVQMEDVAISFAVSSKTLNKSSKVVGKAEKVKYSGTVRKTKVRAKPSKITTLHTLIPMINQKLPAIIAKNMRSPSLEFRTGRFASGVRVTDVVQTRRGFPSFGYTYEKNPYQTFEPGYKQGDTDRDPRKLIDTSIREIAATMAIGRFYTRRV